jgi:hypothetical protein
VRRTPTALRPIVWALGRFNSDPTFQYRFHLIGTCFGLAVMVAMPLAYFLAPGLWASASILALVLITDYGNLTTDYCGVSDSEASGHGAALRGIRASAVHHDLVGRIFDKLALDAHFQYRLHLTLTYNWLAQGVIACLVFAFARSFWDHYALLYTLLQNGYTNFGTDFSALPGTLAARHLQQLRHGRSPWVSEPSTEDGSDG